MAFKIWKPKMSDTPVDPCTPSEDVFIQLKSESYGFDLIACDSKGTPLNCGAILGIIKGTDGRYRLERYDGIAGGRTNPDHALLTKHFALDDSSRLSDINGEDCDDDHTEEDCGED